MAQFRFTSTYIIEADDEKEAREKFADNSMDFAADADIEPITCAVCGKDDHETEDCPHSN